MYSSHFGLYSRLLIFYHIAQARETMITDFDPQELDKLSNTELEEFANTVKALLLMNKFKKMGVLKDGPKLRTKSLRQILLYAEERNVYPSKDPKVIGTYMIIINDSLNSGF